MPIIPGMENVNLNVFGGVAAMMVYVFIIIIVGGVMWMAVYLMSFPIKVTLIPLFGGVEDNTFSIGKKKNNRVKWNKARTEWRPLFPLFNKKIKQPFKDNEIYPGKQVFAFELGDTWIPASLEITKNEKTDISAKINPVPYSIRSWQSLTHKKNAQEFAKPGFWEENKQLFLTIGTVLICCVLCGAVIYFTYKFAGAGRSEVKALTSAIEGFGNIGGIPPQ